MVEKVITDRMGNKYKVKDNTLEEFKLAEGQTHAVIPHSVDTIGGRAFSSCRGLTTIKIPEGVENIGERAFYHCKALTTVVIPKGVTCIGDYAFFSCTNLTSVVIIEGVETIGEGVFNNCTALTTLVIPDGVRSIGKYAFLNCTALTTVMIPDSVRSIGKDSFWLCSIKKVILPAHINEKQFHDIFGREITETGMTVIKQALVAQIPMNLLSSGKRYLKYRWQRSFIAAVLCIHERTWHKEGLKLPVELWGIILGFVYNQYLSEKQVASGADAELLPTK